MKAALRLVAAATAIVAAGAASAQEPLLEPAQFSGPAGWAVVPGTTRVTAREAVIGETLAEQQVRYLRTGRFSEDVVTGRSIATDTIARDQPAYAVELHDHGVGWCTPGGDARDLGARLASTNKERCIFSDPDHGPIRTQGYDGKSPFAAVLMTGKYVVRSRVRISEQPIDFGRKFTLRAILAKAGSKQLRIDYWFDDGANRTFLFAQRLKPGADGGFDLPLWQGKVRLRPAGPRFGVETIEPPADILSEQPELRGVRYFSW
jgi:hypothetical protein